MDSPTQLSVGSCFAERYRVTGRLAKGGMGSVYEVLDDKTDRLRALKIMLPQIAADADMRARFLREASVVGRVVSDHIVEVVDAGIAEKNTPFIVMERLHGEDLGARVEREGPLPPALVVELLTQVARGLDKVHAENIVHRDLKPENLFATRRDDGSLCVKILDFGVAKVTSSLSTLRTTRSLGTPLYMAPEQLTGDGTIDGRADLYALAHVAFSLLVGKPYWFEEAERASNAYLFANKIAGGVVERAGARALRLGVELPRSFDVWFERAASRDAEQRFGSAGEQIESLAEALDGAAPELPEPAPALAPAPRRTLWVAIALALAGAAGLAWTQRTSAPPAKPAMDPPLHPATSATTAPSVAPAHTEPPPSAPRDTDAPPKTERAAPPPRPRAVPPPPSAAPSRLAPPKPAYDPLDDP